MEENNKNTENNQYNKSSAIHHCKLVNYGDEEKRCVKCGYITWNNNKTNNEIIEDMIKAGYDIPDCDKFKSLVTPVKN